MPLCISLRGSTLLLQSLQICHTLMYYLCFHSSRCRRPQMALNTMHQNFKRSPSRKCFIFFKTTEMFIYPTVTNGQYMTGRCIIVYCFFKGTFIFCLQHAPILVVGMWSPQVFSSRNQCCWLPSMHHWILHVHIRHMARRMIVSVVAITMVAL